MPKCPDIVIYLFFSGAGLRQTDVDVWRGCHDGVATGKWTGVCSGLAHVEQTSRAERFPVVMLVW
jgi:hypothetical protein